MKYLLLSVCLVSSPSATAGVCANAVEWALSRGFNYGLQPILHSGIAALKRRIVRRFRQVGDNRVFFIMNSIRASDGSFDNDKYVAGLENLAGALEKVRRIPGSSRIHAIYVTADAEVAVFESYSAGSYRHLQVSVPFNAPRTPWWTNSPSGCWKTRSTGGWAGDCGSAGLPVSMGRSMHGLWRVSSAQSVEVTRKKGISSSALDPSPSPPVREAPDYASRYPLEAGGIRPVH